jgi:DNA polymerase V
LTLGYGFDITGVWLHTIYKIGDRVVMYKDRNIGWARVIAHVDADAFFASCEQLRNPYLRNKPVCVVSGKRGMVIAKSYEAKYKGVKTGMPSWEAKKLIRDGEFIICDHAYYGKISKQIFTVLKRWTEEMEIYSVDECFLDLTTLDNGLKMSFEDIGKKMQREVLDDWGLMLDCDFYKYLYVSKFNIMI